MDVSKLPFDTSHCFIDNRWVKPVLGGTLALHNPSTGQSFCEIARGTVEDINLAVASAERALLGEWSRLAAFERGRCLQKMSQLVNERIEYLAELETHDVGKPLSQARADAIALARYLEFYAGAVDKIHGDTIPYLDGYTVYTLREPIGVTAHIIPWNYPMQIIGRSVCAALAMGNATVLKPAEDACLTALAFADIALQAGLPSGALNIVPGLGQEAGAALAAHRQINHISFTGSVETGRQVQSLASQHVVPVTLELGGKSPQLVFTDADVDAAIPFLVNAGIQNAGQTCSASSRILVHRSRYSEVCDKMALRYQSLRLGPANNDPDVGPLISEKQLHRVKHYLKLGQNLNIAAQTSLDPVANEAGYYVPPTLYADVDPAHTLAQEEIFGPVQVLIPFDDDEEALKIANGTDFGLVASLWTQDGARQMRLAKKLRSGQVFINNYGAGGGVELPFGGTGYSGHGREKGFEALLSFSSLKTVAAKHH